jgi:hypothetical protein
MHLFQSHHVKLLNSCYPPSSALLTAGPDYSPNSHELSRLTYYAYVLASGRFVLATHDFSAAQIILANWLKLAPTWKSDSRESATKQMQEISVLERKPGLKISCCLF